MKYKEMNKEDRAIYLRIHVNLTVEANPNKFSFNEHIIEGRN